MAQPAGRAGRDPRLRSLANRRICGDSTLQQLLYYNGFSDIGWLIFWGAWIIYMYSHGLRLFPDPDIVRTVLVVVWIVVEPLRLLSGWYGNLQESVPWLMMFVLLTVLPQHAVCYYLLLGSQDRTAVTNGVQIVQAIALGLGLILGVLGVHRMYRTQKQQYYIFEFAWNQRMRLHTQRHAAEEQQQQHASQA